MNNKKRHAWYSSQHSDRSLIAGNKPLWVRLSDGRMVEYTCMGENMDAKSGYGDEDYLGEGVCLGAMSYSAAHKVSLSFFEADL